MSILPPPPELPDLKYGTQLQLHHGATTVIADFDFETYSPAGFIWNEQRQAFYAPSGANVKGLGAVGTCVYVEHPDAEVLSLTYDLKDGKGPTHWSPALWRGLDRLAPLFQHLQSGGLLEAWNVFFEQQVWEKICVLKYGFPSLEPYYSQLRCAMAKSRAYGLPGSLDATAKVLNTVQKKDADGKRLLNKFSVPQTPTKKSPVTRIYPHDDLNDFKLLIDYNIQDIKAEAEISSKVPDLTGSELEYWLVDQAINRRGVQIDIESVNACIQIIEQAHKKYNRELQSITNGAVQSATEIACFKSWIEKELNITLATFDKQVVSTLLSQELPDYVRKALRIRQLLGSSAVKKVYALQRQISNDGRVRNIFMYYGARTGRATGAGPQPQNMPNHGPKIYYCIPCKKHHVAFDCPRCGQSGDVALEWNADAADEALYAIRSGCLEVVEYYWGDALAAVFGSLRGLFIAAPNKRLIGSDFSAIEAVILGEMAGEEWRQEVFKTHGKIYEASASKITGIPLEEILNFKKKHGTHHPARKLGKVAELASGYQGGPGAWIRFGAKEQGMTEPEIEAAVKSWRAASPMVVKLWYGLERTAKAAILQPGSEHTYRLITYFVKGDVLYCQLPSGRCLAYHHPRLEAGEYGDQITYMTWNTNPDHGAVGWIKVHTYGGKLTENADQAIARDILEYAKLNAEKAGYPIVLHVYDELVAEVPNDFGSLQEFERIMSTMPPWAEGWPIRAQGGWEGQRYRK